MPLPFLEGVMDLNQDRMLSYRGKSERGQSPTNRYKHDTYAE